VFFSIRGGGQKVTDEIPEVRTSYSEWFLRTFDNRSQIIAQGFGEKGRNEPQNLTYSSLEKSVHKEDPSGFCYKKAAEGIAIGEKREFFRHVRAKIQESE